MEWNTLFHYRLYIIYDVAFKLSKVQRSELQNIIISKLQDEENITDEEIASTIVSCSTRTIRQARRLILKYSMMNGPRQTTGRPMEVTENMWLAFNNDNELRQYPYISQQAMADYLNEEQHVYISRVTVGKALKRYG